MKQEMMAGSGIWLAICKSFAPCSRQITTSLPHHSLFTGRMPFLLPNQQCQSTEGTYIHCGNVHTLLVYDVAAKTDDNVKEISSLNCWELILAGIRQHCSVPKLVTNGCLALAAIVEADGKMLSFLCIETLVYCCTGLLCIFYFLTVMY